MAAALPCVLSWGASGCAEDPGELDRDVVHDLSRQPGDANSLLLSGNYDAQLVPVECGCPQSAVLEGLSLCQGTGLLSPMVGDTLFITFDVVQSGGLLLMRYYDRSVTGGIYESGDFALGGVFDMSSLVTSGEIVTRLDGTFDTTGTTDRFESMMRLRLHGEAAVSLSDEDDRMSIDCVETFELTARRGL